MLEKSECVHEIMCKIVNLHGLSGFKEDKQQINAEGL